MNIIKRRQLDSSILKGSKYSSSSSYCMSPTIFNEPNEMLQQLQLIVLESFKRYEFYFPDGNLEEVIKKIEV